MLVRIARLEQENDRLKAMNLPEIRHRLTLQDQLIEKECKKLHEKVEHFRCWSVDLVQMLETDAVTIARFEERIRATERTEQ